MKRSLLFYSAGLKWKRIGLLCEKVYILFVIILYRDLR